MLPILSTLKARASALVPDRAAFAWFLIWWGAVSSADTAFSLAPWAAKLFEFCSMHGMLSGFVVLFTLVVGPELKRAFPNWKRKTVQDQIADIEREHRQLVALLSGFMSTNSDALEAHGDTLLELCRDRTQASAGIAAVESRVISIERAFVDLRKTLPRYLDVRDLKFKTQALAAELESEQNRDSVVELGKWQRIDGHLQAVRLVLSIHEIGYRAPITLEAYLLSVKSGTPLTVTGKMASDALRELEISLELCTGAQSLRIAGQVAINTNKP